MFDFFRRHTRTLQFVLVLLIFPSFVFFGIQGYSRFSGGDLQTVAKVAGHSVTQAELDAALRDRVDRARRQMPSLDPKLFETPEMKSMALDGVIRDRRNPNRISPYAGTDIDRRAPAGEGAA